MKAFIREDWEFSHITNTFGDLLPNTSDHNVLRITWRYQKNNQNGETIPFVCDTKSPRLCPVAAAQRIITRATRLKVEQSEPLAVFANQKGQKTFIHNLHV